MSVPLPTYAKIKDKYCVAYFGNCADYLVQLRLLRPFMEKAFPGVQVYIAYRDNAAHLFAGAERTLSRTALESSRHEFAYVRELACDMKQHPVEEFMKESNIPCGPITTPPTKRTNKCVLLTQAAAPTRSLTKEEADRLAATFQARGLEVVIDGDIADAECVIGVECDKLFEAGAGGSKVTLVATGIGENIFKSMYPQGAVVQM